jgi:hypothetical protein
VHGRGGPFYRGENRNRRVGSGWGLALGHARTTRPRTSGRRRAARWTTGGDLHGDDAEGVLSVCHCPSHTWKGWVEQCPRGVRRRTSALHLGAHACTSAGLCQGLDGTPSATPASSAGWAA